MIFFVFSSFFRGFSLFFFCFLMFFFLFVQVFCGGWSGTPLYSVGFLFYLMIFVVLVIFFLSLGVSFNSKVSLFFLVPMSLIFFTTNNLFLFCLMFEMTIFPLVLVIFWGGSQPERSQGMYYFLLFSVISSYPFVIMLSSQLSSSFLFLPHNGTAYMYSFLVPFLVKLPMFFFHLWLPKAHVEAPTLGSIVLAGLMLKFGVWGIYRLSALFSAMKEIFELIFVWGMILGSFSASMQSDAKSLVAYSSVCHMNFLGFVLSSFSGGGELASILVILTHGVSSSAMFWIVGGMYYKTGTRQMLYLSSSFIHSLSGLIMASIVMFSNFSVPPTLGFWSEFVFLRLFLSFSSIWFVFCLFYLIVVCYFSVFLMLSVSHSSKSSFSSCYEESFFLGIMMMFFFFPLLHLFF